MLCLYSPAPGLQTCRLGGRLQVNVWVTARFPNGLWGVIIPEEVELCWLPVRQCPCQHHPVGSKGGELVQPPIISSAGSCPSPVLNGLLPGWPVQASL